MSSSCVTPREITDVLQNTSRNFNIGAYEPIWRILLNSTADTNLGYTKAEPAPFKKKKRLSMDLDGIRSSVETCWCDDPHAHFLSPD